MKKKLFTILLAAALTIGAVGCSKGSDNASTDALQTQENDTDEKKTFVIAYAPNESTEQSADARNGLAKDLGEALGMEVEEIQASDYNAIIEALRTGKADMAYMGPLAIALGVERAGVEPIVMKAEDGDKNKAVYHSVFITNSKNSDINSIQDIKVKQWPL